MKYDYMVKYGGQYYAAAEDVPCEDESAGQGGENRMTVAEIKAYAKEHNVDLKGATKKDEMAAIIEAAEKAQQADTGEDE